MDVSISVSPWQIIFGVPGELLKGTGATGVESTTTVSVAESEVHPRGMPGYIMVAVTVYTPVAGVVTPVIDGFCNPDVKAFGPSQLYSERSVLVPVRSSVLPEHIGPLLPSAGR